MSTNFIKLKSLKDPTEESDGLRILIARFRPRYLPKEKENWDEWWKELAPSKSLWTEYLKDKQIDWPEYSKRYQVEIRNNPQAVKALHTLSSQSINRITKSNNNDGNQQEEQRLYDKDHSMKKFKFVTLLCHCKDEKQCHRSIVKGMVEDLENKKI
jgi:uncharacterized protein YeaO (DUF488 family)